MVADTGSGIAPEDIKHIFDRFYQVDKVHPKGSGIGLSLSKAFVELHGGTISVESEVGKGSAFMFTIPLNLVPNESSVDGHSSTVSDAHRLSDSYLAEVEDAVINTDVTADDDAPILLIIDDNRDIQAMLSEEFKDTYHVLTADNGKEGIQKASKYVPDIIICDVMMPEMDGMECCRRLKSEP